MLHAARQLPSWLIFDVGQKMRDDRQEIVAGWYLDAQRFWILSRVGMHELRLDSCAWHVHALSLEIIIKAAILTKEPASLSWSTFNSQALFKERHDVVRLLHRWNRVCPEHAILPGSARCLTEVFSWKGEKTVSSPEKFGSLSSYADHEMIGRYSDGARRWDRSAVDAANIVFFRLREYLRGFLALKADAIDRALQGSTGRTKDADWLRRATRKSNSGIPVELRIHD